MAAPHFQTNYVHNSAEMSFFIVPQVISCGLDGKESRWTTVFFMRSVRFQGAQSDAGAGP